MSATAVSARTGKRKVTKKSVARPETREGNLDHSAAEGKVNNCEQKRKNKATSLHYT